MFTIDPEPCSRITGTIAWQDSKQPLRLTAMMWVEGLLVSLSGSASPVPDADVVLEEVDPPPGPRQAAANALAVGHLYTNGGHAFGDAALVRRIILAVSRAESMSRLGEQHLCSFAREDELPLLAGSGRLAG